MEKIFHARQVLPPRLPGYQPLLEPSFEAPFFKRFSQGVKFSIFFRLRLGPSSIRFGVSVCAPPTAAARFSALSLLVEFVVSLIELHQR
jgi:hypothetical protein